MLFPFILTFSDMLFKLLKEQSLTHSDGTATVSFQNTEDTAGKKKV